MENKTEGPLLGDVQFFEDCLNLDYPGMEPVKSCVLARDYSGARHAFAAYVRDTLDDRRFFTIPYEVPENIYKAPGESDAQACARICAHTLISVGVPCEFGEGKPVDWEANPTYNGYKEWTWQLNRHNDIKLLAHEYNLTHEQILADTAAELFSSWVKQALVPEDCPGYMTKCWRTIECGIRMGANWPYILFTFYRNSAFTDDILVDWYKSVWEHGVRLSRNHMQGNWLIMEMNGLAQIGILYPQFKKAKEWLSQAHASLEEELDRQIYPDGFQFELSTGYHDVVVNNYQRFIQTARAFESPVPEGILRKLETACELDTALMMPNGLLPDINDGSWRSVKNTYADRQRIYPENTTIRWVLGQEGGKKPAFTSVALPWSGFAVMRTGWSKDDAWAFLDAAPYGRAHQHEDKLSVLFYASGKLLLTEGGNYAYDSSPMREYVLSTRSHNTARVDGMDQNRRLHYSWQDSDIARRSDLIWEPLTDWDFCEGSYREGYGSEALPLAVHIRRVFFCHSRPLLVVVDRFVGDGVHAYQDLWHVDSEVQEEAAGRIAFTEADLVYSSGTAAVITGQEEPEWQGFVATGTKQGMYRSLPCVSVENRGKDVRVATVISPRSSTGGDLSSVQASLDPAQREITICFTDGRTLSLTEPSFTR